MMDTVIDINDVLMKTSFIKMPYGFVCQQNPNWVSKSLEHAAANYVHNQLISDIRNVIDDIMLRKIENIDKKYWKLIFHIIQALKILQKNEGSSIKILYTHLPKNYNKMIFSINEKSFQTVLIELNLAKLVKNNKLSITSYGEVLLHKEQEHYVTILRAREIEKGKKLKGPLILPGRGICLNCGKPAKDFYGQYCFSCRRKIAQEETETD
jgi:hypothetical protein